jgi:hypothetical protein
MAADPGLEQDLGAELFNDLDARIEAGARRAFAEHEMFRPHPDDRAPAAIGRERPRIGRLHRQLEARGTAAPAWLCAVTLMKFMAGAPMANRCIAAKDMIGRHRTCGPVRSGYNVTLRAHDTPPNIWAPFAACLFIDIEVADDTAG